MRNIKHLLTAVVEQLVGETRGRGQGQHVPVDEP